MAAAERTNNANQTIGSGRGAASSTRSKDVTLRAAVGVNGARRDDLLRRLRRALSSEQIVSDAANLQRLSADFLRGSRAVPAGAGGIATPMAGVRPHHTEDVATVVRIAAEGGVPIVEYGGGTGLMGGARTVEPGIVLDLRSMKRVLAVRAEDRTAHVEAGIVLADLAAALEPHGLILGHDPWTFPIATVGGTISTNGLGYLSGRYGSMGDQVLGLTVVLADGTIVTTRPALRSSTGPRLRALFAGAEGTLGIITEAVLRVFPRPEREQRTAFRFDGFDDGFGALQAVFAAGITPALVDFGQTYGGEWSSGEPVTPAGMPGLLNIGFQGLTEEVRALSMRTHRILAGHGGRKLPAREANRFWGNRHVVAEQIRARQQASPDDAGDWPPAGVVFDFMHVALPPSAVLAYKGSCEAILTAAGLSIGEWGLWNSPELFSVAVFKQAESTDQRGAFREAIDAALRHAQEMGGSMEYCHGAGVKLAQLMEREHGAGMGLLRAIKHAVDPNDLLNPGKIGL